MIWRMPWIEGSGVKVVPTNKTVITWAARGAKSWCKAMAISVAGGRHDAPAAHNHLQPRRCVRRHRGRRGRHLSIATVPPVAGEVIGAFVLSAGNLYDSDSLLAGIVVLSLHGLAVSWLIGRTERLQLASR